MLELDGFTYRDLTGGGLEGIHGYTISVKSPDRRRRQRTYDDYDGYRFDDFDESDWEDNDGDFDDGMYWDQADDYGYHSRP